MSYEQYWYDDPLMVRAFYKAEKIRQKRIDEAAWVFGVYTLQALDASVGNMFLPKGRTPIKYPDKPILTAQEIEETKRKTVMQEEFEKNYALAYMTNMVMIGKNWDKNKQ